MASLDSPFRGYKSIERIVARMLPLAQWMLNHSSQRSLTLAKADLELIKRWPKAASLFNIYQREDGSVSWSGFTLCADNSKSRNKKGSKDHGRQAEIG